MLTHVNEVAWFSARAPKDWQAGVLIPIHKSGDVRECSDYWGISLLTLPGKVYAKQGCGAVAQAIWMAGVRAKNSLMVEPEPEIWVPFQASCTNTMFFMFFGPNCSGAGAKKITFPELEPEPKVRVPAPQPWYQVL